MSFPFSPATADEVQIRVASEYAGGYDRNLFKHWIDADKNGCDTRKEVLIYEAIVKPKKGAKCTLTGGKWISPYDGKTYTKDAGLDIDHVVPLAEAWRSGAWAWTAQQRQDFANDLMESRALIAVTASANRSKSDQDVKTWLPAKGVCTYIEAWVAVKVRYTLTFDTAELAVIQSYFASCPITNVTVDVLPGYETGANKVVSSPTPTPTPSASISPQKFKMPLITEYKLGDLLKKWPTFGFKNKPVVVQQVSGIKEYSCKPITNDDFILDIQPKWNTLVDEDTQVSVTLLCSLDFESKKPTTAPLPSPSPVPSEATTNSPAPTLTQCNDGTFSSSTGSGTCSGHGGIATASPTPESTPAAAATSSASKQCWVSGYTRKNGTVVKGYYRSC